jgi:hypothetical protein
VNIKEQITPIPFGSYGDFSCIVEHQGRKTFFKSMIEEVI